MLVAKYMDVILREFEERDVPRKVEWINNPANNQFLHYDLPLRIDRTTEWFRRKDNSKRLDCIIEYNGTPVGLIGLLQIDKVNRKAEYYITIGETGFKQKGIATKATKAIIDYAFEELNLHKVYLTVDARNTHAIRLYEKAGFKQEGYFIDDLFRAGNSEFIDRERYAIIKNVHGGGTLYYEMENLSGDAIFKDLEIAPTPVQCIGTIGSNNLFVKREDLIPVSFGGNKARKACLFFNEIDAGDYNYVVTYGSSSSNHCRVVANLAASRGIRCILISPEEASEPTFNSRMMELFGAKIITVPVQKVHDTIAAVLEILAAAGKRPYFIAGGGHGDIGTQAYVNCYEEIHRYEQQEQVHFDYIFHASGTGTTQAGLVCGQLIHGDDRKIIGISIARKNPRGRDVVIDSIRSYLDHNSIEQSEEAVQDAAVFVDDYTGSGYAQKNDTIEMTIRRVLTSYGIPLDSTYTGKAFAGMEDYLKKNGIQGKNILFIHTGGTPLFFDDIKENGI